MSASLWEKRIPIKNGNGHVLEFTLKYTKGGTHYATYKPVPRSYRLNVIPVKIVQMGRYTMREFGAFTGFNATILEVNRQSKKQAEKAIAIVESKLEEYTDYWIFHHGHQFQKEQVAK